MMYLLLIEGAIMAEGDFIKTRRLEEYPNESQELMIQIISDFESRSFRVVKNNGSYSIIDNERNTVIKIVCTNGTKVALPGLEIGVFFRAELIDLIFLDNINKLFPTLRMRDNLYKLGGGVYRDFCLTVIDSIDTYNSKRHEIIELCNIFLQTIKYFAYGSNMNFKQMQDRCSNNNFINKAYLEGYRFVYDGKSEKRKGAVANVIRDDESEVWGGIFEITKKELSHLNCKEGFYSKKDHRNIYDRDFFRFYFENKEPCYAFIYHREKQARGVPSEEYKNIIIEGAKDCGLPENYIKNTL